MTIILQTLPRATTYDPREVSTSNQLRPAFGGAVQTLNRKGAHWAFDVSVPALNARCSAMGLMADLLRGQVEAVAMAVPDFLPFVAYGTPVCDGVATGLSLPVRGLPVGAVTRKGKWLSIILGGRRYLHLVTGEVAANSQGKAVLPIWPMLRRPTSNGAVVELTAPRVEGFIPGGQGWSIDRMAALGVRFTLEERE